jgi:hypothetical protein
VFVVSCLRGCETDFVDAIVDGVVDPGVEVVDVAGEVWGNECSGAFVGFALVWGKEVVECGDDNAGYFRGFVVDDRVLRLLENGWIV